ncbi:MAG: acyltransferase [Bacteroidota bacterium]
MNLNPINTIGNIYNPKENGIGFMRLVLALFVVIQHSFALNNLTDPLTKIGLSSFGSLGVNGFFILSGYLIAASWLNNKSFISFSWRRILRIFPAFWICLLFTSFIIAPIMASIGGNHFDIVFLKQQLSYVYKNLFLIIVQPDIANLSTNYYEHALNGSFWTLSWEFSFYILIAIAGIVGLLNKQKWIFVIIMALYIFSYWASDCKCAIFLKYYVSERIAILPFMFGLGALGYLFKHKIPNSTLLFIVCIIAWVLDIKYNLFIPLHPFFFLYIILWLMVNLPIKSFEKNGDYSYGIYIYHFPIIQLLLLSFNFDLNPWLLSSIAIIPTGILAYLSWHYIERPALSFKKYFKNT